MKTYYIYNQNTDEFIGKLKASSIVDAELKSWDAFEHTVGASEVYALTTAPDESFA